MSSNEDLTRLLRGWPEGFDHPSVRIIRADDGRMVIQRRVPMGIVQMETDGRPDALRPHGLPSLLEAFRTRWPAQRATPSADDLSDAEDEALLYLQRAAALAGLGDFDAVVRDTAHVRALATLLLGERRTPGASGLEALRIQAIILQVRAEVAKALRAHGAGDAVAAIDRGLAELGVLLDGAGAMAVGDHGLRALHAMRATLVPTLPSSQREELRERLEAAIRAENFELAAILRDELRHLAP